MRGAREDMNGLNLLKAMHKRVAYRREGVQFRYFVLESRVNCVKERQEVGRSVSNDTSDPTDSWTHPACAV